jgi:NAD-dependent dihydropyrimidine dehydrogenase PreA subunit
VATLVLSELFADFRRWSLFHLSRIVKPGGRCIIADEGVPRRTGYKLLSWLLRAPAAVATFFLTGRTTAPFTSVAETVKQAGFEVERCELSRSERFATVVATKPTRAMPPEAAASDGAGKSPRAVTRTPDEDISMLRSLWDLVGRWFPNPVEPGIRVIGNPDATSPVIVTSNFHRTVLRVEEALNGLDCYLLVVPAGGINVWCGACGGSFTVDSVIKGIKTSELGSLVEHRSVILPQLAAPGLNAEELEQQTGWEVRFGPVRAADIERYLERERKKSYQMRKVRFDFPFRMEMLLTMNIIPWLVAGLILLVLVPMWALWFTLLFWSSGVVLYGFPYYIPGKSSMMKVVAFTLLEAGAAVVFGFIIPGLLWWSLWYYMAAAAVINLILGYDVLALIGSHVSAIERLVFKTGVPFLKSWFTFEHKTMGALTYRKDLCTHCRRCFDVCPQGVFGVRTTRGEIYVRERTACFACNACITQCPTGALVLEASGL